MSLDATESSFRRPRVVVLAPPSLSLSVLSAERVTAPGASAMPPAEIVRCASGYEAAAELLVDHAAVLVVELSRITAPHVGLLRLAERLGVPVLAYGAICADLGKDVLAHLRLVGAPQLEAALAEMLASIQPPAATAPATPALQGRYASQQAAPEPAPPPAQPEQVKAPPGLKPTPRLAPIRQAAPPPAARHGDEDQTP